MENLTKIFTSEDLKEIKTSLGAIIVEQFKVQLEEMHEYLFSPEVIEEMITDAFSEIIEEVKNESKRKIKEKLNKLLDKKLESLSL